jgi:hypothetical protein
MTSDWGYKRLARRLTTLLEVSRFADSFIDPRDYKIRSQSSLKPLKTAESPMRKAAESVVIPKGIKEQKEKKFDVKVKQLLGELYVDRKYLEQFLVDKGISTS